MASTNAPGKYSLRITNKSGQDLQGGGFQVFYDDAAGVRTPITWPDFTINYTSTSTLATNASVTAEFTRPAGVTNFILVYKGTIGTSGGAALDPVDATIGIAATRFTYQEEGPGEDILADDFLYGTWVNDGQVVAVLDANARITKPAGSYRATHFSGHATIFTPALCNSTGPGSGCNDCTETSFYTYTSWPGGARESEIRCPDPNCIWDNSPETANAGRVEQNTAPYNFCHQGGLFGPVVEELNVCEIDDVPEKATDEGGTFDPGTITYAVERLRYRHMDESEGINSLRVKDLATIKDKLQPCSAGQTSSSLPEWTGEIPFVERDPCWGFVRWHLADPQTGASGFSLNGYEIFVDVLTGYDLPTEEGVGWRLDIWCKLPGPGGGFAELWYGYKSKGYTPKGTYVLDLSDPNIDNHCIANEICCITIE